MACDDCKSGFRWGGAPTGNERTLAGMNTYVAGDSRTRAIMIVHDIFGWKLNNARLLADHFAAEVGATVYLPDFFDGEVVSEDIMTDVSLRDSFSIPDFIGRHSKARRWPSIRAAAQALKSQYPKVGAIGYCYGGWAVFQLGADPSLIDAISMAHPSMVTKEDVDNVSVPVQIMVPENEPFDGGYVEEMQEFGHKTIPKKKVPYGYEYFPSVTHGFATRGDREDRVQTDALERAKRCAVGWFKEWLVEAGRTD